MNTADFEWQEGWDNETFPEEDKPHLSSIGFDVGAYIGKGTYGIVFNGICNQFAQKGYQIRRSIGTGQDDSDISDIGSRRWKWISLNGKSFVIKWLKERNGRNVLKEAHVLIDLVHPNILEVYFVCQLINNYYIVMEYLNSDTLRKYLQEKRAAHQEVQEIELKNMFVDLLEGLKFLHSRRIIHKDIHDMNVMFHTRDQNDPKCPQILKYVDFSESLDIPGTMPKEVFDALTIEDLTCLSNLFLQIMKQTNFVTSGLESDLRAIWQKLQFTKYNSIEAVYGQVIEAFAWDPSSQT